MGRQQPQILVEFLRTPREGQMRVYSPMQTATEHKERHCQPTRPPSHHPHNGAE